MGSRDEAGLRREYRTWVRAHHPDAGGDPGAFAAGLGHWRDRLTGRAAGAEVAAFRAHGGRWPAVRWRQRRQPPRVR
jgi:hypothetical protein